MIVTGVAGLLVGGCDPVTMGVGAGASLAANALFGDSKMTQVAREAYVRAPICSARPNGIPNGRITLVVRGVGWYSFYPLPDGRSVSNRRRSSAIVGVVRGFRSCSSSIRRSAAVSAATYASSSTWFSR